MSTTARTRARSTILALATLVVAACVAFGFAAASTARAVAEPTIAPAALTAPSLYIGTLDTHSNTAASESSAGIKMAMMELSWRAYEPQPGVFDTRYEAGLKAQLAAYKAAGMQVTLGLGLHFTPSWALALPNSHFVDEYGNTSVEPDFVFDQELRTDAEAMLARANAALGFNNFYAIRVTSGGQSELMYPQSRTYWAYDVHALTGSGLPASQTPNPFPTWKAGTAGLTQAQVTQWSDWYIRSLVDVAKWQMSVADSYGYTGYFQVLTPGMGVVPSKWAQAIAANMPDGLQAMGVAWGKVYADLAGTPRVQAYISSLADGSGDNSGCTASDRSVSVNGSAYSGWSAARWISRLADQYGFGKAGENPGFSSSNSNGYAASGTTGMLAATMHQAQSCGFSAVYWAHDDQLWNGTLSMGRVAAYSTSTRTAAGDAGSAGTVTATASATASATSTVSAQASTSASATATVTVHPSASPSAQATSSASATSKAVATATAKASSSATAKASGSTPAKAKAAAKAQAVAKAKAAAKAKAKARAQAAAKAKARAKALAAAKAKAKARAKAKAAAAAAAKARARR